MADYDVTIVGMGPGGEVVAGQMLAAGRSVAIIERELIGGECGYWACIPTKTLLRPVQLALETRETPGVAAADVDWASARSWRDDMVRHLDDSRQIASYEEQGATVIKGQARLAGPGTLTVDDREVSAEHIVLATGSVPIVPDIPGLSECTVWTNREATNLSDIPRRALIIGTSAVAVEVSQYLRGFGAEVTLIGRGHRILGREEPRVAELAAGHLRAQGIGLQLGSAPVRARRSGADSMIELDNGTALAADVIILATGRHPRTEGLGLDTVGIEPGPHGGIPVDNHCRAAEGIWAVGDVTGVMDFTHVAKYQGRIVAAALLGRPRAASYDAIPRVVFGHPEIAAVGLTEEQALAAGRRVVTTEVDLTAALARPWTQQREPAPMALGLTAEADAGLLLGAWAVAPESGEWIHHAALAIRTRIPIEVLRDQVAQFPSYSEGYQTALDQLPL